MSYTFNMTSFDELHIINVMYKCRPCDMGQCELLVIIRFVLMFGSCDLDTTGVDRLCVVAALLNCATFDVIGGSV